MKQINSFGLMPLRNGEHHQFHSGILLQVGEHLTLKVKLAILLASYLMGITAEEDAMQQDRGGEATKMITDANIFRGELDRSFSLKVEAATLDYDPLVREAGERLMRIFMKYGDLRKEDYNNQTSKMTVRNTEINDYYAADVVTIKETELFAKLDEANKSFNTDFGVRNNEMAARIGFNVIAARAEVDPIYDNIKRNINALAIVEGDADYAEVIDRINAFIAYYKNVLAIRRGRNKAGDTPETPELP